LCEVGLESRGVTAPFSLFLASLGTSAGIYVLGFRRQRGVPADGIRIVKHLESRRVSL
jgi:hypothetical protein